jgi:chromosome segregation ATPase
MEIQHADALKALQVELEVQKKLTEAQKAELESQKTLTKEQEEKARNALSIGLRHQRALNDMRNVTIPGLKAEHDRTVADLRSEVGSLTSQLNATKTELESAQRDLTRLKGDVSSRDTQIQELNATVERLNAVSSKVTQPDTSDAMTAVQRDLDAARQRIGELETAVAKAAQGSQQGGADVKTEELESRLRTTAAELEAAHKQMQDTQNSMVSLTKYETNPEFVAHK